MNAGMFRDLLGLLIRADVEFILIGGLAAIAHGTSRAEALLEEREGR